MEKEGSVVSRQRAINPLPRTSREDGTGREEEESLKSLETPEKTKQRRAKTNNLLPAPRCKLGAFKNHPKEKEKEIRKVYEEILQFLNLPSNHGFTLSESRL